MRIKRSNLAGTWYAGEAGRLRDQVDQLLASVETSEMAMPVAAVVVPHAAYQYSGRAAASAYALLRQRPLDRVVLLAPSHYASFRGAAVLDADAFETPLGLVAIDAAGVRELSGEPLVHLDRAPYEREHALEIQLPLLQRVAPSAAVVPLLLGGLRADDYDALAGCVARLLAPGTLVVVSSDFTHYGAQFGYLPFPPTDPVAVKRNLAALDQGAINLVAAGDFTGFQRYVAETGATICGRMPIGVLLRLRRGAGGGQLLSYYTSLDVTGDYQHSVSYAAIAFAP